MRIETSNVRMESQHSSSKSHARTEFFTIYQAENQRAQEIGKKSIKSFIDEIIASQLGLLPDQAFELQQRCRVANGSSLIFEVQKTDPLRVLLEKLLNFLTEQGIRIDKQDQSGWLKMSFSEPIVSSIDFSQTKEFEIERRDEFREAEKLEFKAAGAVKTGDHRQITFETEFNLNREYQTTRTVKMKGNNIEDLRVIDPLIVNCQSGFTNLLENQKFKFDLNADGIHEELACLEEGSGFLALDRNRNGKIDNGKELFGPTGGNGFQELAEFDQDHNGWIDEADLVFDDLKIWRKDNAGNEMVCSLEQKGIGAICLQNTSAEFGYQNDEKLLGQAQRAGIFLREDGTAGTVQQVDLVG